MSINSTAIQASAQRLFPNESLEQVMVELLLERAQKNLIRYQTMVRQFETRYGKDFESFRQTVLNAKPSFEVEQDYFDWELATTGMTDMEEEIEHLRRLNQTP
jgi:hypothetical protein